MNGFSSQIMRRILGFQIKTQRGNLRNQEHIFGGRGGEGDEGDIYILIEEIIKKAKGELLSFISHQMKKLNYLFLWKLQQKS